MGLTPTGDPRLRGARPLPNFVPFPYIAPPEPKTPISGPQIAIERIGTEIPPREPELIEGLLPATGGLVALRAGPSGSGKSFYICGEAFHLATGLPFLDRQVSERVGSIIIAAEGGGTIDERIHALRLKHHRNGEELPIGVVKLGENLADDKALGALVEAVNAFKAQIDVRLGVIYVDTVTAAFAMIDENNNSEATRIMHALRRLAETTGTVVCPVHHFGKNKENGLRGASAWRGMADQCVAITCDRNEISGETTNRRIAVSKNRSGVEGPVCSFQLLPWPVGGDRMVPVLEKALGTALVAKQSKTDIALEQAYVSVFTLPGNRCQLDLDNGTQGSGVLREKVRDNFISNYDEEIETAKRTFNRALNNSDNFQVHNNNFIIRTLQDTRTPP